MLERRLGKVMTLNPKSLRLSYNLEINLPLITLMSRSKNVVLEKEVLVGTISSSSGYIILQI